MCGGGTFEIAHYFFVVDHLSAVGLIDTPLYSFKKSLVLFHDARGSILQQLGGGGSVIASDCEIVATSRSESLEVLEYCVKCSGAVPHKR